MAEAFAVLPAQAGATQIAASAGTTCALVGGQPRCWGFATDLLGPTATGIARCLDGRMECTPTPTEVASPVPFEDIFGDPIGNTMFGITYDSRIYGWGISDTGLLSAAHVDTPTLLPAREGAVAHRLSVANGAACAVVEGTSELRC
jgi:hypothetical protein